jgi:Flp pilus assembly pilin Flp
MNLLIKSCIKADEAQRKWLQGQTMTEYALIVAAIALVVFAIYQTTGTDIRTVVNSVNTKLTTAAS